MIPQELQTGARPRNPTLPIVALAMGILLANTAYLAPTPFLLNLADDLHVSLAAVGFLVAISSIPWGLGGASVGALSDRLGRRPMVVAGTAIVGLAAIAEGLVWDYPSLLVVRLLLGLGGGMTMPNSFALVGDLVPPRRRGGAFAILMVGGALGSVVVVPLLSLAGALAGWRVAFALHGLLTLAVAPMLWRLLPAHRRTAGLGSGELPAVPLPALIRHRPLLLLLAAQVTDRLGFAGLFVYIASFLTTRYQIGLDQLAVPLAVVALGGIPGNLVGGRLADRFRRPIVYACCQGVAAVLALATFQIALAPALTVLLGFAFAFANAASSPSMLGLFSEIAPTARGRVMGLWTLGNNIGWFSGPTLGGLLITAAGYPALGLSGLLALGIAATLALSYRPRPVAERSGIRC